MNPRIQGGPLGHIHAYAVADVVHKLDGCANCTGPCKVGAFVCFSCRRVICAYCLPTGIVETLIENRAAERAAEGNGQ